MDEQVCFADFIKGRFKTLHQLGRQLSDEAHCICKEKRKITDDYLSHGGVKGGK